MLIRKCCSVAGTPGLKERLSVGVAKMRLMRRAHPVFGLDQPVKEFVVQRPLQGRPARQGMCHLMVSKIRWKKRVGAGQCARPPDGQ